MCNNCIHSHIVNGVHITHSHKKLISDIHSTLENELENANVVVFDDEETKLCREEFNLNPLDTKLMEKLADCLVFQMRYREAVQLFEKVVKVEPNNFNVRRKLAARYMSILQIEKAEKEFLWCDKNTTDKLDTAYRLALCSYYKGDYETALKRFLMCYPYCENNDEMLIAVIYWEIICEVKLKKDISSALFHYKDSINCGHHIGYMQAVKLFCYNNFDCEKETEDKGELAITIYLYGAYNYYIYKNDLKKAREVFERLMPQKNYFSSFAYLGAYSEKLNNNYK